MTVKRPSRIAVAAVIAPFAFLTTACGDDSGSNDNGDAASDPTSDASEPTDRSEPPTTPAATDGIDYVADGLWHQADGDTVALPKHDYDYEAAVLWNDELIATRWDGEVFSTADVIDQDGNVVESFGTTSGVVVNESGTTLAWVGTDGKVMTAWEGDQVSLGSVDLSAPGEAIAWSAVAITGGPNCYEDVDGCVVYINSSLGKESRALDSHGINDIVAPGVTRVFDATDDGAVSVINKVTDDLDTCGGLLDLIDGTLRWTTCDHQVQQVSPDGGLIAAPQSQYDGLGPTQLSILDADSGQVTGTYGSEGGFIGTWAWTTDGDLLFSAYDGANWHLFAMDTTGAIEEITDPIQGEDVDSPFTLIAH